MSTQDTAGTAREGMTMDTEFAEMVRAVDDLRRAERERDDLAATLETRTAEHALAMAQLAAVTRERDVALGQQAPLLDAHDALVAAARAAGWTGAGATGAELVAWVRRGAMQEARNVEAPKVRALRTAINALCNVRTLRATCAEGETWRAHVHDKDWTDARANALAVLNATGGE